MKVDQKDFNGKDGIKFKAETPLEGVLLSDFASFLRKKQLELILQGEI